MENIKSDEGLRIYIMGFLSDALGEHVILKGGMVLRLLNCPRYTNDLDYLFVPYKSKKQIPPLLEKALANVPGLIFEYRLHSTNAQFDVTLQNANGVYKTQIEINVADECASQPLSTGDIALSYDLDAHIIRVMRYDIMLAHKLAAWNERRLIRDLYDIYFIYKFLDELPDITTLKQRLEIIHYAKRVGSIQKPRKMELNEFLIILETEAKGLTEKAVENELRDYFNLGELVGMDKKIKIAILQLIEAMREKESQNEPVEP